MEQCRHHLGTCEDCKVERHHVRRRCVFLLQSTIKYKIKRERDISQNVAVCFFGCDFIQSTDLTEMSRCIFE